jgi:hypothetical protein
MWAKSVQSREEYWMKRNLVLYVSVSWLNEDDNMEDARAMVLTWLRRDVLLPLGYIMYSKCHVTSNKVTSKLECAEDKFQTRGWVRETPPTTRYARDLTKNAGPCSKLRDTCYNISARVRLWKWKFWILRVWRCKKVDATRISFPSSFPGVTKHSNKLKKKRRICCKLTIC